MAQKIVVVDDEADIRELLHTVLERAGYEVHDAADGLEGQRLVKKVLPHLAIIDLMMPKMNGYELIIELQKDPKLKDIPLMVITSLTEESKKVDEQWRDSLGVADFITKPFVSHELVERVGRVLGSQK